MPTIDIAGNELSYRRAGEGEPIVLIQGMSGTHMAWGRPFLSLMEQSFDCVVFDNRGMGESGRAQLPFTTRDLAEDVAGLMDGLGLESSHVLGISMGGMIAQELALDHPDRIRTLTIGASFCGGPDGTLMARSDLELLGAAYASGEPEKVFRAMWEINLSPRFRADDSRFAAFREMASALPAPRPVVMQQMQACAAHDTSDRLQRLEMPVLVIHGTADRLLNVANGKQIASLIPGSRLELMEDVGHLFWWEEPERSAELIREHALAAV